MVFEKTVCIKRFLVLFELIEKFFKYFNTMCRTYWYLFVRFALLMISRIVLMFGIQVTQNILDTFQTINGEACKCIINSVYIYVIYSHYIRLLNAFFSFWGICWKNLSKYSIYFKVNQILIFYETQIKSLIGLHKNFC